MNLCVWHNATPNEDPSNRACTRVMNNEVNKARRWRRMKRHCGFDHRRRRVEVGEETFV